MKDLENNDNMYLFITKFKQVGESDKILASILTKLANLIKKQNTQLTELYSESFYI